METNQYKHQGGFTLLELVVVVAVLGLIANLATEFVAQNTNQERFNTTKARQAMIREAILGNPSATQNGEVQVSGFIADTGRAPKYLIELITQEYCKNTDAVYTNQSDCEAASVGGWNASIEGWNGPYLHGYDIEKVYDSNDNLRYAFKIFRDGWGNTASAWADGTETSEELEATDVFNFGWNYDPDQNDDGIDDEIILISAGLDGTKDPEDSSTPGTSTETNKTNYDALNIYEQDYPRTDYVGTSEPYTLKRKATIFDNEYTNSDTPKLTIDIDNTGTDSSSNICVLIKNGTTEFRSSSPVSITASGSVQVVFDYDSLLPSNHGLFDIDLYLGDASCSLLNPDLNSAEKKSNPSFILSKNSTSDLTRSYTLELTP